MSKELLRQAEQVAAMAVRRAEAQAEPKRRRALLRRYLAAFHQCNFQELHLILLQAEEDPELEMLLLETVEDLARQHVEEIRWNQPLRERLHRTTRELRELL